MWNGGRNVRALHDLTREPVGPLPGPTSPQESNETTIGIRHPRNTPQNDDESNNPRPRQRSRPSLVPKCCECTRHGTCSANVRTNCECRSAGRECYNCCPDKKCKNRRSESLLGETSNTPGKGWANQPPPPGPPPRFERTTRRSVAPPPASSRFRTT